MAYTLKLVKGSSELDLMASSFPGFKAKAFDPGYPEERHVYGGMTGDQLVRVRHGPREMTMTLELRGSDRDDMIDRLNDLREFLKAASDYHENGWGDEVFLQFQFDGATFPCRWPVLSGRAQTKNVLQYARLESGGGRHGLLVEVTLRTKAEWEATTTYSLDNYLGTPHFEEDGNSDGLADQWNKLGTPTTTLDTTIRILAIDGNDLGTQSQKVVTDSAGDDGIYSDNISDTETSGVGYAWVYKASGDQVAVQLYDATASSVKDTALYGMAGWATKTGANGNTWKRLVVSSDSLTSGNNHCLRVIRRTGDASAATTYYVDQCYLELGTSTMSAGWASGRNIKNVYDSIAEGNINYIDVADIPGDIDARCKISIYNSYDNTRRLYSVSLAPKSIAQPSTNIVLEDSDNTLGTPTTGQASCSNQDYTGRSMTTTDDTELYRWILNPSTVETYNGWYRAIGRPLSWADGARYWLEITIEGLTVLQETKKVQWNAGDMSDLDLGLIYLPPWDLQGGDPYQWRLSLYGQTDSPTQTVNFDCLYLMPAEKLRIIAHRAYNLQYQNSLVDDDIDNQLYSTLSTERWTNHSPLGSKIALAPETYMRIWLIMEDNMGDQEIARTARIGLTHRPRGLHFRGGDL